MSNPWEEPWFWPAIAVVVGLPVALLVLTEIIAVLDRRSRPAARVVRLARNYLVPVASLLVLVALVSDAVDAEDITPTRVIATVFGFLVILLVLNSVNLALFGNARAGSWRERLPSIFIDIGRLLLILVGLAILFSVVWDADVGGLFTALGVTSIVVGLALQNAVGSVVSGLLLLFEAPFRLGDYLDAEGTRGRVIEVNWRAVHIDTGNGVQIVPNASLAGASFTNLSRGGASYTVETTVDFTTDDPPAEVCALLRRVASGLPALVTGTSPVAMPAGGTSYRVGFEVRGPAFETAALAQFRLWLWYAARRAGLGLDGDTTDDFISAERVSGALRDIAPMLYLSAEEAEELAPAVSLMRFAAGETLVTIGTIPDAVLFVMRGTVTLSVVASDGALIPVTQVDAGDYLAQTALTRERLLTTATAATEVAVLSLPAARLDDLVRRRPQLARDVSTVIERRRLEAAAAYSE